MMSYKLFNFSNSFSWIIFDVDGTLYPRNLLVPLYYKFVFSFFKNYLNLPSAEVVTFLEKNGITKNPRTSDGSATQLALEIGVSLKEWNEFRSKHFAPIKLVTFSSNLYKCVCQSSKKYKLVVITNGNRTITRAILKKMKIDKFITLTLSPESTLAPKPSLELFHQAASQIDESLGHCLSIGDRYALDIKPIIAHGGAGMLVSGPSDIINFFSEQDVL